MVANDDRSNMTRPKDGGHLAPEELARIAEGGLDAAARDRAAKHLAQCRVCAAIHADFVRALLDPSAQTASPAEDEWVQLGLQVGAGRPAVESRPRVRWRAPQVLVPGLAICLLGVGALWSMRRAPDRVRIPPATRASLEQLVRADSYKSLLYSTAYLPAAGGTRGNPGPQDDSLLNGFGREFAPQAYDPEVAFWLVAGRLASGHLSLADAYLEKARLAFPQDARFENLAAILAYKRGQFASAEADLRKAAAADHTDLAKFNLVRVLEQLGRHDEAVALETELRKSHSGARLAAAVDSAEAL